MNCDREGCDTSVCGRISDKYGRICHYCIEELKRVPETNISEFMSTKSKECRDYRELSNWEDYLYGMFKVT